MRWAPQLNAAGVAIYLSLVLWIQRTGGFSVHLPDLLGSCLIALTTAAIGWHASGYLTRDPDRRGLIALVATSWGPLFATFHLVAVNASPWLHAPLLAGALWTVLSGLAVWLITRGTASLGFATRAIGIATVILLGAQSVQALKPLFRGHSSALVPDRRDGKSPDVFVIALDKYSSGEWLRHAYDLDHSPFEDSLRALGFVVPVAARANYAHTELSLASFLNWRMFETPGDGHPGLSWALMRELIAKARTWDVFRAQGYRVVAFPTTFTGTRTIAGADVELRPRGGNRAPFGETWRVNSPLASWSLNRCVHAACAEIGVTPYPIETVSDIDWKLKTLASLPDSAGPVFAFLHLLAPHEPYLFNPDCSPREPWWPLTDQGADFDRIGAAYATQVRCLDHFLLRTVRSLLERSPIRPVVILQGDHGHGRIAVDPLRGITLSADELMLEQLGERLSVFAAYLFPGADTAVYENVSAINVMPMLLRELFGMNVPEMPDRSLWSTYQDPFSFTEIDPAVMRPSR